MERADRLPSAVLLAGSFVLGLHAIAPMTLEPALWGAGTWRGVPGEWRVVLIVVGVTLLVRPRSDRALAALARPRLPSRTAAALLLGATALFWLLRSETHWGNFGVVANAAYRGEVSFKHALSSAAASGIAAIAQRLTGEPQGGFAVSSLAVVSGGVFLAGAFVLGRELFPGARVRARGLALVLVTAGFAQQFFGVLETYPLSLAGQVWTLALVVRQCRAPRGRDPTALLLVCATTSAVFIATVFLWPATLLAIVLSGSTRALLRPRAWLAVAAPPAVAWTLFTTFSRNWRAVLEHVGGIDQSAWVPWSAAPDDPRVHFTLLSWEHLVARLDAALLVAPAWLPLLAAALVLRRPTGVAAASVAQPSRPTTSAAPPAPAAAPTADAASAPRPAPLARLTSLEPDARVLACLALAALSASSFFVLVHPDLGPTRDWMQTATGVLAPYVLITYLALRGGDERDAARVGTVCLGLSVLHTLPWVLVNAGLVAPAEILP